MNPARNETTRMAADSHIRALRVKELARSVGFDACGITDCDAGVAYERYQRQMAAGYGADMGWLHETEEQEGLRKDVSRVHAQARSVVVVACSYASDTPGYLEQPPRPDEGWIARYAQGKDYHVHIRKRLVRLVRAFEEDPLLGYDSRSHRVFVDTGPVLEKAFAQKAGLGWIGKNTLLLSQRLGSWQFLGVILTPLVLAPDTPGVDHCGTCRRCLDVCPTDAFVEPYVLDARRCIATWTIESADPVAVSDPNKIGQHVFGCDLCQEVCPWNRKVPPTDHLPLRPRPENVRPPLQTLMGLDDESFKRRFPKSAVRRTNAQKLDAIATFVAQKPED